MNENKIMFAYKNLWIVLLAFLLKVVDGQVFTSFSPITLIPPQCEGKTTLDDRRWQVNGTLHLTTKQLERIDPKVRINSISAQGVQSSLCVSDVSHCISPDYTRDVTCSCSQQSRDVYTMEVTGRPRPSQSGGRLEAVLVSRDVFDPVRVISNVGVMPDLTGNCSLSTVSINSSSTVSPSPTTSPDSGISTSSLPGMKSSQQITQLKNCMQTNSTAMESVLLETSVLCEIIIGEDNWVIIQRRNSSAVDFYQTLANYTQGFGELTGNFWQGLQLMHILCGKIACELRIDLTYQGVHYFADYGYFSVANSSDGYRLTVHSYTGTAGDEMTSWNNGFRFSTWDKDRDGITGSCPERNHGGWWYGACSGANPNGLWGGSYPTGVYWRQTTGYDSAEFIQMKIRTRI